MQLYPLITAKSLYFMWAKYRTVEYVGAAILSISCKFMQWKLRDGRSPIQNKLHSLFINRQWITQSYLFLKFSFSSVCTKFHSFWIWTIQSKIHWVCLYILLCFPYSGFLKTIDYVELHRMLYVNSNVWATCFHLKEYIEYT